MSTGNLTLLTLSGADSRLRDNLNGTGITLTADQSDPRVCGAILAAAEEAEQWMRTADAFNRDEVPLLLVYGDRVPYGLSKELRSRYATPQWEVVRLFLFRGRERALLGGDPDGYWVPRLRRLLAERGVISLVCRMCEVDETVRQLPLYLAWKEQFYLRMGERCDETGARLEVVARALGLDKRIGQGWLREERCSSENILARWLSEECARFVQRTNVGRIAMWGSGRFWKQVSLDWTSGRDVRWFSPGHMAEPNEPLSRWKACRTWRESVAGADLLVIGEANGQLREIALPEMIQEMECPRIIDACACFPLPEAEAFSVYYRTIGQNTNVWEWNGL